MNNVYIHATSQIYIIDMFGNFVDEIDWNDDNHIHYDEFDYSCDSLDDIEYYEILDFTKNKIIDILNEDKYLEKSYPNCSFELDDIHICSIYNDENEKYF